MPELRLPVGRLVGLALLAFTVLASYEAARPPVESLFLDIHGKDALPTAWLAVAVGAVCTVGGYNWLAARTGLMPLMVLCALLSGGLLVGLLWAEAQQISGYAFALYIWKDLYIVVLIETFWAYSNATMDLKAARWVYGGLLVAGTLGSLTGGTLAGLVASEHGLHATLWLTLPLLGAVCLAALALHFWAPTEAARPEKDRPITTLAESLAVLRKSDYLVLMLLLILSVQFITTLVDYTYNGVVASAYPDRDLRTVVISDVYRWVNGSALALQLGAGLVLGLGLARVFIGLPLIVGATVIALAVHPVFLVAAAAKVVGKCVDYSIFRAAKEMLYIPLSYAEQTQGKALVDILTYRVAKGGAALALHGLIAYGAAWLSGWLAAALVVAWVVLAVGITRRYHARVG